jgi:hypothetical protein
VSILCFWRRQIKTRLIVPVVLPSWRPMCALRYEANAWRVELVWSSSSIRANSHGQNRLLRCATSLWGVLESLDLGFEVKEPLHPAELLDAKRRLNRLKLP